MLKSSFKPCLPTRSTKVPDRPDWIHEIKHDGYRLIVQRVRLFTRNGHDWTALEARSHSSVGNQSASYPPHHGVGATTSLKSDKARMAAVLFNTNRFTSSCWLELKSVQ
jgi:hypothetical protein